MDVKPPVSRKRRRADGTLRPTVARRQRRLNQAKMTDERRAWLAQFPPKARAKFFLRADLEHALFLRKWQADLNVEGMKPVPREDAAQLLSELANHRGWLKLATSDGLVVGIAPPVEERQCANASAHRPHRWNLDAPVYCIGRSGRTRSTAVGGGSRSEPDPHLAAPVDAAAGQHNAPSSDGAPVVHVPERSEPIA